MAKNTNSQSAQNAKNAKNAKNEWENEAGTNVQSKNSAARNANHSAGNSSKNSSSDCRDVKNCHDEYEY